jgi:hypothetical protein
MIKELKIGNYVKYNGCVVSVYAISNQTPNKDKHFDNKARVTLWCNGLIDATIDEIEPIPITEELLLKCGFDEPCDVVYEHNYGEFEVTKEQEKWWVTWNGGADFWFEIKHLHQLQNAYYLATGKELEIKL